MPIKSPSTHSRKKVSWLNLAPPEDVKILFQERDRQFMVESCDDTALNDHTYLAGLWAVIFTQDAQNPQKIREDLKVHAEKLLNYDCYIILRPGSKELSNDPSILLDIIDELKILPVGFTPIETQRFRWLKNTGAKGAISSLPHLRFFRHEYSWKDIANAIFDNLPGPAPDANLVITSNSPSIKFNDEEELLIKRAFHNCADVHFEVLEQGKSGVRVYRVHAELSDGLYGKWPQPYFVKMGDREKILSEYNNYIGNVGPYLPFHLGPKLVPERCCLGAKLGMIVGDFVEESESLCDSAAAGRAANGIACLFDRTLAGWYRSAIKDESTIAEVFETEFPSKINESRLKIAYSLGATKDLIQLKDLFKKCLSKPILIGPIHGDLHAANIRIRATDAILIDFLAHKRWPLLYDPACLEASLLVDGFAKDTRNIPDWITSISALYENTIIDSSLSHPKPKEPSSWFHSCIRQIRRYARQWDCSSDHEQYAAILALTLLRKATKDPNVKEPENSRRAAAYLFAEKILTKTFGGISDR